MRWLYDRHGLLTEPSGAIAVTSLLSNQIDLSGDVEVIVSDRNVDVAAFRAWIAEGSADCELAR